MGKEKITKKEGWSRGLYDYTDFAGNSGWDYHPKNTGAPITALSAWHYNDSVNPSIFPRWKTFAREAVYRSYRIPDVQSRIDYAEPENMYGYAEGCGLPPLLPWGASGQRKLANYRACTASTKAGAQDLDSALAEALRKKASQSQGMGTGAIIGFSLAGVAILGTIAYFMFKK